MRLNPRQVEVVDDRVAEVLSTNPHFSQGSYCGGTEDHVYGVPLNRPPRHTVKYACGGLNRAPCIHGPLHRLAAEPCEKSGLKLPPKD